MEIKFQIRLNEKDLYLIHRAEEITNEKYLDDSICKIEDLMLIINSLIIEYHDLQDKYENIIKTIKLIGDNK